MCCFSYNSLNIKIENEISIISDDQLLFHTLRFLCFFVYFFNCTILNNNVLLNKKKKLIEFQIKF